MKDQQTIEKFIELRARGLTYARIAVQLGVSVNTLVNWSREHRHRIQNLRAIEWEVLVDQTLASQRDRLKALAHRLDGLETELAGRQLADVSTAQLHFMVEQLHRRLARETGALHFSAPVSHSRYDDSRETSEVWQA